MTSERSATGNEGEEMVAALLQERGFSIVGRNARVGRYEIDIVATRNRLLVFCEVRTRRSTRFGDPAETVGPKKIASLRKAASKWLEENTAYRAYKLRFDVAGVLLGVEPKVDYYPDAF